MKKAMDLLGYDDLRKEQEEARKQGRYIVLASLPTSRLAELPLLRVVGSNGPCRPLRKSANVRVQPTGKVSVYTGSHSHGQGQYTTFAQVVADHLGIALEDIEIIHGDLSKFLGMGTYGSRGSLVVGGSAIVKALDKVKEKGAKVAAHLLEASEQYLESLMESETWK